MPNSKKRTASSQGRRTKAKADALARGKVRRSTGPTKDKSGATSAQKSPKTVLKEIPKTRRTSVEDPMPNQNNGIDMEHPTRSVRIQVAKEYVVDEQEPHHASDAESESDSFINDEPEEPEEQIVDTKPEEADVQAEAERGVKPNDTARQTEIVIKVEPGVEGADGKKVGRSVIPSFKAEPGVEGADGKTNMELAAQVSEANEVREEEKRATPSIPPQPLSPLFLSPLSAALRILRILG